MSIYIRPEYFEIIHYYYFSIGIFSLVCAIIFGVYAVYSYMFIILYLGLSSFSWYVAQFMQKRMREFVILNSSSYAISHILLTFFIGGMAFVLWFFNAFNEENLIIAMLQVNYFVLFLACAWYLIIKFGVVKAFFDVYDSRIMENAKKLVVKIRKSRKDIFTKTLISDDNIKNYKIGSDQDIDEMLMHAWKEKGGDKLLKTIANIEIAFCSRLVDRMKKRLAEMSSSGAMTPKDVEIRNGYEQLIEEYVKSSVEYEKDVVNKIPAE